jgi:site-specific DNA recombinase
MKKNIRQAKKLTVAYLRVSSEEQRERHTIETQRAEVTRYAALRGIKIDRFYEDDGVSGTVAFGERPQGGTLWEDIVVGKIAQVLIYGIDRIARRAIHTLNFVDHVDCYGVQISSVREQIDLTSSMGRLMLTIAAAFAENERNTIVERTTAGLRRRVESGKITTPPPYGYTVEDGRLVIDEERADVVRTFFNWYVKGVGPLEIVRRLTETGAPSPRGKGWRHDTLLYLLKQRAYVGDFVHFRTPRKRAADGARVPRDPSEQLVSNCPAIVTRRLFDAVQAQIQDNKTHGPQSKKRTYLLRRLIRCGTCDLVYVGHAVSGRRYKDKVYPDFRYYECASLSNRDYKYCGSARVDARDIEEHVWSEVEDFLRRPSELTEKLLEQYQRQTTGELDAARKVARIQAAIKSRIAERNRIVGAVGRGKISEDDASDELHRLAAAVVILESELDAVQDALASNIKLKERLGDAREMLEALSSSLDRGVEAGDKAELIRLLVDTIKIVTANDRSGRKRPHAVITYLFPASKDIYFSSKGAASRASSRKKWKRRPRRSSEPERVRRLTRPPEARPYSAEN